MCDWAYCNGRRVERIGVAMPYRIGCSKKFNGLEILSGKSSWLEWFTTGDGAFFSLNKGAVSRGYGMFSFCLL